MGIEPRWGVAELRGVRVPAPPWDPEKPREPTPAEIEAQREAEAARRLASMRERLTEMVEAGEKSATIMAELGIERRSTLDNELRRLGLRLRTAKKFGGAMPFVEERRARVAELHAQRMTAKEIAEAVPCTYAVALADLRALGLDPHYQRTRDCEDRRAKVAAAFHEGLSRREIAKRAGGNVTTIDKDLRALGLRFADRDGAK